MNRNDTASWWEALLHAGHSHSPGQGVSRRRMLGTAGAAGALLVTGFPVRAFAAKPGTGVPKPQPHVTNGPFGPLHFYFPGPVDGSAVPTDPTGAHPGGRDPSTIYDFNGFIGQADLSLSGTGTDLATLATDSYTFNTDMRFMKGVFIDTEGRTQRGSFAFIWLDSQTGGLAGTSPLPEPTPPHPIGAHSYDPGTANGLLWTVPVPEESIEVRLGAGEALLHLTDFPILDAFTVPNSLNPAHPAGIHAAVINSLRIRWSGIISTTQFTSTDPDDKFLGYFLENSATIEVTVTTPASGVLHGFRFVSDEASTSVNHFSQIGHESNGAFFE